jgi:hypothetical protein
MFGYSFVSEKHRKLRIFGRKIALSDQIIIHRYEKFKKKSTFANSPKPSGDPGRVFIMS